MSFSMAPLSSATALRTPLPRYRLLSPSLSSSASRSPVDAPDGTPARPNAPPSSVTSTSTVGLPRESRISRPRTSAIFIQLSSISLFSPAVSFRLELQRVHGDLRHEWFVAWRHDDHPTFRHDVAAAIFFRVVADHRAARNVDIAVDDGPLDARV